MVIKERTYEIIDHVLYYTIYKVDYTHIFSIYSMYLKYNCKHYLYP